MIRRLLVVLSAFVLLAVACGDEADPAAEPESPDGGETEAETDGGDVDSIDVEGVPPAAVLEVVGRAEYVSGGDVLIHYDGPDEEPAFEAGGAALESTSRGDDYHLVSGLDVGPVTIEGGGGAVEVVNHPITGPVFSGPHQDPLYCALDRFGLTAIGDDDCSAEIRVQYGYVGDEGFVETNDIPGDAVAIRLEMGTINRGIYSIAVADPSLGAEPISPGKNLIYMFGGGCGTGHTQAPTTVIESTVFDVAALEAGYIVATSTFNVLQAHCNDVLSAETLMMTKEHINESIGPVNLTIGRGGSGGAIQQYSIVQNYPGLLDAVSASVSFPDSSSISGGVTDCGLLLSFYGTDTGASFTPEQQLAVNGHGSVLFCRAWAATFLPGVSPSRGCDEAVPAEAIYDPESNPTGIRCTQQDSVANVFGVDENGFGRRPLDNTGVQYGFNALNDGVISVDQFLDLNEEIGGYDIDGHIVVERTAAAPEVVELAYATGRVLRGDSGVLDVPIIDIDFYSDLGLDIHDRFRLFTIRARMASDDGSPAGNRVIWTRGGAGVVAVVSGDDPPSVSDEEPGSVPTPTEVADWLVEWATTGERPEGVADDCVIGGRRVVGDDIFDPGQPCAESYPLHGDPRTAAGQSLVNDIIKCTTTTPLVDDYDVEFTSEQFARLEAIFADGVCDYAVPGVGQVPLAGTWLEY